MTTAILRHQRLVLLERAEPSPTQQSGNGESLSRGGGGGAVAGRGAYASEANFDTNMVIILAALLCALICALGLNSIARCALRCGRRLAFESADEAAARLAATGLKKSALRRIPVSAYGSAKTLDTDCTICLAEFAHGDKLRVLPRCSHGFHVACIDPWLASHSSCPTCRSSLLDRQGTACGAASAAAVAAEGGGGGGGDAVARQQHGGQSDQVAISVDEVS